jgi:DNA (cytosine-5)-methyltransferase 1
MSDLTVVELCAGAGGQSLGLEQAGFRHVAAIDNDNDACNTLKLNRPDWLVMECDVRDVNGHQLEGVDLLAAGVPCPPFSIAGKQLGQNDERDLFPEALRLAREIRPKAILLENVRGFAGKRFEPYRARLRAELEEMGYWVDGRLLKSCWYGVPQLRPRFILVALPKSVGREFSWPSPDGDTTTVAETISDLMAENGWRGVEKWSERANALAPTIVGGSKKHGGPDLGPTRARQAWRELGVDGMGIADEPPGPEFPADGFPRLTTRMVARIQGFPDDWSFSGRKTAAYRQVGNAFPPPVASAVGGAIAAVLGRKNAERRRLVAVRS